MTWHHLPCYPVDVCDLSYPVNKVIFPTGAFDLLFLLHFTKIGPLVK